MPPLFLLLGVGSGPTGKQLEARSLRGAICKGETQVLQGLEPKKKENYRNEPPEGAVSGRETQKPTVTHWVPGTENVSVSLVCKCIVPRWRAKEPLCAMGMAERGGG